jgi:CMP-N-acetylneuraminate monooxygenase
MKEIDLEIGHFISLNDIYENIKNGVGEVFDNQSKKWLFSIDKAMNIKIFEPICPHQGMSIKESNGNFFCTGHKWIFDKDGKNEFEGGSKLNEIDFLTDGDRINLKYNQAKKHNTSNTINLSPTIDFVSHASLVVSNSEYSFITDPWTLESTYSGNWVHWPPGKKEIDYTQIDHIFITHEHPDHLHPESLLQFPKDKMIFYPKFISGRIEKKLANLGFRNIYGVDFDEEFKINENYKFYFNRPSHRWEDSILQVNFYGFKWLNMNDAGYFHDDWRIWEDIDLLTAAFDVFASDFPMCWELNEKQKRSRIELSKRSMLSHLTSICDTVKPKFYLPFASFWRLDPKKFTELESKMNHLSIREIRERFKTENIQVKLLDLLPGERFDFDSMELSKKIKGREQFLNGNSNSGMERSYQYRNNSECSGKDHKAVANQISDYMSKLVKVKNFFKCENLEFNLICECGDYNELFKFEIKNHIILNENSPRIQAKVHIDKLKQWINDEVTWEELRIGYWIKFSRNQEVYTPNFLRMLAFGPAALSLKYESETWGNSSQIALMPIGELVKINSEVVSRVLNRAGLPCLSCKHFQSENLGDVVKIHKLTSDDVQFLYAELETIIN